MSFKAYYFFLILISVTISFSLSYEIFKQNAFLFFDPVSETTCDEKNYWTPFDKSTTCYRFVNLISDDSSTKQTLTIMLDHNIATSTFKDYKTILTEKTKNWNRFKGKIDIIDEETIYKIMKYEKKPTILTSVAPPYRIGQYYMNSQYIINGKTTNENGYWTKTETLLNYAYIIDNNGNNKIISMSNKCGIRPVITINKSLLVRDSPVIDINNLLTENVMFKYPHETIKYDNLIYEQLQGFTVTKDKLVFISSNNENREKSVLYSYLTKDLKTLYKKQYTIIGHGNGMTYNSKTNKILIAGPDEYSKVLEFDATTLKKEKEYPKSVYPKYNGIGYDYIDDLYVGYTFKQLFLADSSKMLKIHSWDIPMFETAQDIEFFNGYLFFVTSELGAPNKYQSYSFFEKGANIIYVYDMKLDGDKKPTKNFGRLICRLYMDKKGELEDVAFRNGNIYLGFATRKLSQTYSYTFYQINYKKFAISVQQLATNQGSNYFN